MHSWGRVWLWTNLNPKVETDRALNAWLKAVKLTNLSQVHLQAVWAAGHGQVSSCGEAHPALVPGTPHPQRHHPHILSLL